MAIDIGGLRLPLVNNRLTKQLDLVFNEACPCILSMNTFVASVTLRIERK